MPIQMIRLQTGVYIFHWVGRIMPSEAHDFFIEKVASIREGGETPLVAIHNLKHVGRLPTDIRGFSKVVNAVKADVAYTIVAHAPPGAGVIINAIQVFAPVLRDMRICRDMDEAKVAGQSVRKALDKQVEKR